MPTRIRAYRTALKPTKSQEYTLRQICGVTKFVWNRTLAKREALYRDGQPCPSEFDMMKQLTVTLQEEEFQWMRVAPRLAMNATIQSLYRAYRAAFRRVKAGEEEPGFPKYKGKGAPRGFKFFGTITVTDDSVTIPSLGVVRLHERGYLPVGRIKLRSGAVTCKAGRWIVSLTVDEEYEPGIACGPDLGIDLGVSVLATFSDGSTIDNPKYYRAAEKRLRRLQRSRSRMKKGGANRRKQNAKIAALHAYIANQRANAIHHLTSLATRKRLPARLAIETLNVSGMVKNRRLAKSVSDAGFGEIARQLEYKAEWHGVELQKIDPWYPSSQLCSRCGYRERRMKNLSIRTFTCSACGLELDRDVNAAINIRDYRTSTIGETSPPLNGVNASGEEPARADSMNEELHAEGGTVRRLVPMKRRRRRVAETAIALEL